MSGSTTDFGQNFAIAGEWVINRGAERTGVIVVEAAGSWTLTLTSLFDLPAQTGPVTVTGSGVVHIGDVGEAQ